MILKFNNGRGALLCEQCSIIVMEDMKDYEWRALSDMEQNGYEWFCKECSPETQKQQGMDFVEEVNKHADKYAKSHQDYIARRIIN